MPVDPEKPAKRVAKKATKAAKTTKTTKAVKATKAAPAARAAAAATGGETGELLNPHVRSVTAFFPCYNDERSIPTMIEKVEKSLQAAGVDYEIIVINDASPDNAAAVLDALQAENPRLRVITHGTNRGYGGALKSGIEAATKDWVFYTDGDGQYDPSEITTLIDLARDEVDVVQGYKIGRSDSLMRKIVGRTYHHGVAILFNLEVQDVDCDFRLMRRAKLQQIELVNNSGAITMELCRKLQVAGARWVQTGVHHYNREYGASQFFTPSRVAKTLWDLARMWVQLMPAAAMERRRERKLARGT